jgi:hypothetical protein
LVTYLEFITPLVGSQRQADANYFDLSNAYDFVPHTLLPPKLSAFGLFDYYVTHFAATQPSGNPMAAFLEFFHRL